ncbi:hypothetical protein Y032_0101g3332 [Ancylostoma ceylanicum]|uniref:Uncharacterized protein n=1 Tax=Ancylostoma ceylanicum TaxID=53326 RepID=A0A016THM3_9BILA|nr:hypothetical protein Y032_0101g3332 [Ancylostoma ceylanicum]
MDLRVSPDFATTDGDRDMDKVEEDTANEAGDELRLAAIHELKKTWRNEQLRSSFALASTSPSGDRVIRRWFQLNSLYILGAYLADVTDSVLDLASA